MTGRRDHRSAEDYGWWAEQLGEVLLEAPVAKRTRRAWERWLGASFRRDSGVEHSAHSA